MRGAVQFSPRRFVPDESWFRLEDPSLTAGGLGGADTVATAAAPATAAASGDGEHLVVGAVIRAWLQLVALGAARGEVQTAVAVEEPDAAVARVFRQPFVVGVRVGFVRVLDGNSRPCWSPRTPYCGRSWPG
jgi:hypothetical protein